MTVIPHFVLAWLIMLIDEEVLITAGCSFTKKLGFFESDMVGLASLELDVMLVLYIEQCDVLGKVF